MLLFLSQTPWRVWAEVPGDTGHLRHLLEGKTQHKLGVLCSAPCRSVLTVACEQTEVLLFDPISSKHIKTLSEAHEDCVNNIRWVRRDVGTQLSL